MSGECALTGGIEVRGAGKKFRVLHEKQSIIRDVIPHLFRLKEYEEFWALRDVEFEVSPGETLGIIGRNGSGKSTLLRILAGITPPTEGTVACTGKISTLLELGAGFQQELTGLENIFLNATILGLRRREIERKMKQIIEFAELGDFIDAQLKVYSSGMYVRLGFAIAIHVDFHILLVDEILAVGDAPFQRKCMERIEGFRKQGRTIVMVTHSMDTVRGMCDRAIWLEDGRVEFCGPAGSVVDMYMKQFGEHVPASGQARGEKDAMGAGEARGVTEDAGRVTDDSTRWGTRELEITGVDLVDGSGRRRHVFHTAQPCTVRFRYRARGRIARPVFGFAVHRDDGLHIAGPNARAAGGVKDYIEGEGEVEFSMDSLPLLEGTYLMTAAVHSYDFQTTYDYQHKVLRFQVAPNRPEERYGLVSFPGEWRYRDGR